MSRKIKRLLIKIALIAIFFWVISLIIFRVQTNKASEQGQDLPVVRSAGLQTVSRYPLAPINPRDAELQLKFAEGQKLLEEAEYRLSSATKNNNQRDVFAVYGNLDEKTKLLIQQGLIVPRWDLLNSEIPEYQDAPGELGRAHSVNISRLTSAQKMEYDKAWQDNAFNGFVSDMISLHRTLEDIRDSLCKNEDYSEVKLDASVIIIFHNEDWQVLLRTVHSVMDRSPPKLLREVILVDDYSNMAHLGAQLDNYMAQLGKVKVLRANKRQGLIRARLIGAAQATGDVLTFLDSHCECTKGWLQPLLKRIQEDESHVVTPVIDVIDESTFKYMYGPASSTNLGGFDWTLQFTWHAIPFDVAEARRSTIEPLRSPTMAGGLFAISRKYFEKIGAYDPGMEIWGGENLELSFRVWMCGGSLEIIQCSHVGHVFRKRSPYKWTVSNALRRNSIRTALVWMDDYSKYYFEKTSYQLGNYGDISERVALRKRLNCKSFRWYLDNIYSYQFVPGNCLATGQIKSMLNNPKTSEPVCIGATHSRPNDEAPVKTSMCIRGQPSQMWYLTKRKEIYVDHSEGSCLDYARAGVKTFPCHGLRGNQEWEYRPDQTIIHLITNLCLEISLNFKELTMETCTGADNQKWIWSRNTPDR